MKIKIFLCSMVFALYTLSGCSINDSKETPCPEYETHESATQQKPPDTFVDSEYSKDDDKSDTKTFIRYSNGLFMFSYEENITEKPLNKLVDDNPIEIAESDTLGDLVVKKIINIENKQTQILFDGDITLSGILYCENGNSNVFSDDMENGWLLFFPDTNSIENKLPISYSLHDNECIAFYDRINNFSFCRDTEPILLSDNNSLIDNLDLFYDNDYVYLTIKIRNYQIRKNLYWLTLPYESVASLVEVYLPNTTES